MKIISGNSSRGRDLCNLTNFIVTEGYDPREIKFCRVHPRLLFTQEDHSGKQETYFNETPCNSRLIIFIFFFFNLIYYEELIYGLPFLISNHVPS